MHIRTIYAMMNHLHWTWIDILRLPLPAYSEILNLMEKEFKQIRMEQKRAEMRSKRR